MLTRANQAVRIDIGTIDVPGGRRGFIKITDTRLHEDGPSLTAVLGLDELYSAGHILTATAEELDAQKANERHPVAVERAQWIDWMPRCENVPGRGEANCQRKATWRRDEPYEPSSHYCDEHRTFLGSPGTP